MFSNENGEAFNVGNDREISIRTLAETMAQVAAPRLAVEYRAATTRTTSTIRSGAVET